MRTLTAAETLAALEETIDQLASRAGELSPRDRVASRHLRGARSAEAPLYGAPSAQALYDEVCENYRTFREPAAGAGDETLGLARSRCAPTAARSPITPAKTYLDFAGGYGVFTLGHRHPRVVAAVREQLDRMALSGNTMFNPLMGRLAKRLAGADAGRSVDLVLREQRHRSGRRRAQARARRDRAPQDRRDRRRISRQDARRALRQRAATRFAIRSCRCWPTCGASRSATRTRRAGCARRRRRRGHRRTDPGRRRRQRCRRRATCARCARLCDRSGAVLIADEVQTGLGRCGALFACDREGVVPDVHDARQRAVRRRHPDRCVRRAPGGVECGVRQAPLLHTSTFGGSELACAAALAALDVLVDDDLVANARERGEQLLAGVRGTMARFPAVIADARGRRVAGRRRVAQRRLRRNDHPRDAQSAASRRLGRSTSSA